MVKVFGLLTSAPGVTVTHSKPSDILSISKGKGLTVIIPTAGQGRRMKSYGPKALIELKNSYTLLHRQLEIIKEVYPLSDILVVLGFEAEKVYKIIPPGLRVVENELHEENNVVRSIDLGLKAAGLTNTSKVLVIYGDLVFNKETIENISLEESFLIIDEQAKFMREEEVGVTVVDNYVTRLDYGLKKKWAQICYLTNKELTLFRKFAADKDRRKCFGFEVLNSVLDKGGDFKALSPEGMKIAEIDSSKDIEVALKII